MVIDCQDLGNGGDFEDEWWLGDQLLQLLKRGWSLGGTLAKTDR
jgi:hypothetical protein